jgi:hypothetical protein
MSAVNGAAKLSAVELVRSLPDGFKAAVLAELLREQEGSAADRAYLALDPAARAELMRPYTELDLDDTLSAGELAGLLNEVPRA